MNAEHLRLCASAEWGRLVADELLPWVLGDDELGDDVLEIGAGPGLVTDLLADRVPRVTAVELDPGLAAALRERMAGRAVEVLTADATDLPLPSGRFSAAACFTMLHHIPTTALQDRLLAEAGRVLRPGGTFAGSDSRWGPLFALAHLLDTLILVDPQGLPARLRTAGFTNVDCQVERRAFRFRGQA